MASELMERSVSESTAALHLVNDSPSQIWCVQTREPASPAPYALLTQASKLQAAVQTLMEAELWPSHLT